MLTVAVLYVVVTGLTETGAVGWIIQPLLGRPRSPLQARLRLMVPVAALSAFMNNTPVVAVFIPAVQDWAKHHRLELSRLMIPLSYASIAGGACTLIGTSTNLVVNGMYSARTDAAGFGLFEIAWVGVPIVATVLLFLLTAGHWLLPQKVSATDQVFKLGSPRQGRCFVEAVLSDSCPLVGKTVRDGRFRNRYSAVIIALARNGERLKRKIGDIELHAGDTLLLEDRRSFVEQQRNSRDFLLVSQVGDSHPPHHERAPTALAIVAGMVVAASTGVLSMLEAALLAAGLMVFTECTDGRVARRAPDWQVLVVIATSFGIGAALEKTGAAGLLAGGLIGLSGGDPWLTLALVFLATALLTSLATNNVAAVLVFPIALQAAEAMGAAPEPFLITLMIAASASFATPIGYQTNLMVFNVGGYRFSDFVRIGVPLTLLVGIVTIVVVPQVWGFQG